MRLASLAKIDRRAGHFLFQESNLKTLATSLACLALLCVLGCSKNSVEANNSKLKPVDSNNPKPTPVNKDKSQRDVGNTLK